MKKQILLIATALLLSFSVQAQDLVYEKGDNIFNAGFGLGYYGYGALGTRSFSVPAITANYEVGIHEYFGVGPYAGFAKWNYRSNIYGYDYGFSIFTIGGRGSFHFSSLLNEALDMGIDDSKLDLYIALLMGMEFQTYSGDYGNQEGDVDLKFGPVFGVRYYLSNNFGLYFEGGRGSLGWATFGLSLKM
ncbi:hypothetical protein JKA74_13090 [Marivirga sp. S37H4]|uniref:Outer membrane protein beta-barrel domain-containing protein n=1 Tax=Marivirga aurantiaca TaxID=2802615 RepID=A0A934WZX4_9BACT|nr:hypothetical protein [Marivirga aurantiaca]MBK6265971.1 hypothetical protein [Marivirga aurantiaca]